MGPLVCGRERRVPTVKPLIGITSYAQEASWGHWTRPAALVPLSYVRSVELAGGRPLVVPPVDGRRSTRRSTHSTG